MANVQFDFSLFSFIFFPLSWTPCSLSLSLSFGFNLPLFYVTFLTLDFSPLSDSQQRTSFAPSLWEFSPYWQLYVMNWSWISLPLSYLWFIYTNLCLNTWQVLRTKISENINYLQNLLSAFYYYFIYDFIHYLYQHYFSRKVPDSKKYNYVIFHARKILKDLLTLQYSKSCLYPDFWSPLLNLLINHSLIYYDPYPVLTNLSVPPASLHSWIWKSFLEGSA